MLRIDFNQTFLDHRSVLVLVKKLGSVKEQEFSQFYDSVASLRTVHLPNGRTVHLRYTRHISHQYVDWGRFHTHKKLLGILSVARVSPDKSLDTVKDAYESLKTWYNNTSLDSRCFLLGFQPNEDALKDKVLREFVFLKDDNILENIEKYISDYALSLFLVLDAKRMEQSLQKPDKIVLLRSPLDGELAVDGETRNRKMCLGRMKKYLGDLCLLTGLSQEALFHYRVAIDLLRSTGDSLWLCGSFEGLCAASLFCRGGKKTSSLERQSLQLNINQLSTAGTSVNGINDVEEIRINSTTPLTDEEIVEKSEDIFQVYDKHKDSKVLGIEARFKYARFFIEKKRYKDACHVLQDVLSSELHLTDAEKIQQYSALSKMYEDIGFLRKAAFFTRMAARHCTTQHLPVQGWTASYNLLRHALDGYKIHFDKNEQDIPEGWPQLQITLVKELIKMSEELQTPEIPIRHISYLLHAMYKHMDETDISDLTASLESLAGQGRKYSLVENLVLSNGDIIPPVSWTHLPVVRDLKVNVLASHLRPILSPVSPVITPFIYSTLTKKPGKKHNTVVNWVEGDVGEVSMQVFNPMPFDIKVSKMTLLTEGLEFEAFPSCLALSNDSMSHPFMLLGIPKSSGQLQIKGYSVEVFGIQSNCAMTTHILENPSNFPLLVNVTPKLPLLQFHSDIKNIKSSVKSSHKGSLLCLDVHVFNGQRITGPIIVENVGTVLVESFTITLLGNCKSGETNLVEVCNDKLSSLPLQNGCNGHFAMVFNGILDHNTDESLEWLGKVKVLYSGGLAWQSGISRQAVIDIQMTVVNSLKCSNFQISALESDDGYFELSMDVYNATEHDIQWRFDVNKAMRTPNEQFTLLPSNVTVRSCLVLEKFDLSDHEDKQSELKQCVEILSELVSLHWKISDHDISGTFHVGTIPVDENTLNILRRYYLRFELRLNGLEMSKEQTLTIQPSEPVTMSIKALNCSDREVKSSILNIEPYEICDDGNQVFDVKSKICWFGSTSTILPKIEVNGFVEHRCGFLFLASGQYYINVKCFEQSQSTGTFRVRSKVIKSTASFRSSRSSRSESFTDTLLVRQRSFSTPLAVLANSAIINVVDNTPALVGSKNDPSELEQTVTSTMQDNNVTPQKHGEQIDGTTVVYGVNGRIQRTSNEIMNTDRQDENMRATQSAQSTIDLHADRHVPTAGDQISTSTGQHGGELIKNDVPIIVHKEPSNEAIGGTDGVNKRVVIKNENGTSINEGVTESVQSANEPTTKAFSIDNESITNTNVSINEDNEPIRSNNDLNTNADEANTEDNEGINVENGKTVGTDEDVQPGVGEAKKSNSEANMENNEPISQANGPVSGRDDPISGRDEPIMKPNQSVSQANDPISQDNDPMSQDNDPISQANDPMSQDNDPISQDNDPISQDNDPISQDNNPISQHNDPISQDNDPISGRDEAISGCEEAIMQPNHPINQANDPITQGKVQLPDKSQEDLSPGDTEEPNDNSGEELVRSPSVKDRIMFFSKN